MQKDEADKLLKEAKEKIDDPDVIVTTYDLTFQWVSKKLCKIIGYDASEIINKQTISLHSGTPEKARKDEAEIFLASQDITKDIPIKTKKGELIRIRFKISHFTYEQSPYMVGKILKVIE